MKSWLIALLALCLPALAQAQARIVSIGGDVTEILYALGAQQDVVARDSTSLRPQAVLSLPDVGYMRQLNPEGILALKPTLVIASELSKPSLALQQVEAAGVKVVTITGTATLDAINQKIDAIAAATGRESQAAALKATLSTQLNALNTSPLPVKVLFIMNHSGMKALAAGSGTGADGAIRAAGLVNAMGNAPRYQAMTQEGMVASAPQLLVMGRAGIDALGGEANVWKLPGLALTPAGQGKKLLVVDEMSLLSFGLDTPATLVKLRQAAEALTP